MDIWGNKSNLSLLSLNGCSEAKLLLISYIGAGKGGVQALLNFRLVCKTTHSWVEELPRRHKTKIFRNTVAKVNTDNIYQFLRTPCPQGVSYLKLEESKNYRGEDTSRVQNKLWNNFEVEIRSKFRILHVKNNHTFPPLGWLSKFLKNNSSIVSLRVNSIQFEEDDKEKIHECLINSECLEEFQTNIANEDDLKFLTKLVQANKQKKTFNLIVSCTRPLEFIGEPGALENSFALREFLQVLPDIPWNSNIQLFDCDMSDIRRMLFQAGLERSVKNTFQRCIISIKDFDPENDNQLKLSHFPNLKSTKTWVHNLLTENEHNPMWANRSLVHLKICSNLEYKDIYDVFPIGNNLQSLELEFEDSKVHTFLNSMCVLAMHCQNLNSLKISWKWIRQDPKQFGPRGKTHILRKFPGFPVLKNFSLNIQSEFTNWNDQLELIIMHFTIREAREYVIKYLEIKNWQLDRLSLSFTVNNEISLHDSIYAPLFRGTICNTLKHFDGVPETIVENLRNAFSAENLLELKNQTRFNNDKYNATHGRLDRLPEKTSSLSSRIWI